ncbi:MAG TPA: sulfotransferase, partial [Myxococcota bacterium]|nr:sulfotransferase [Myxococcota bacterium]
MSASADPAAPVGTLDVALNRARRLLSRDLALAAEQASEILRAVPEQPMAALILGIARRERGDATGAIAVLEPLAQRLPSWAAAHYELGIAFGAARRGEDAIAALERAVALAPELPDAWRALADHKSALGDDAGADAAYARHIKAATRDPQLLEAGAALCENKLPVAEAILRPHLQRKPTDVAAIRMLAEVAARLSRYGDAEKLLTRCLELAPSFMPARLQLAFVLHRAGRSMEALVQVDQLLGTDARNPAYRNLKAGILARLGEVETAAQLYAGVLGEYAGHPKIWTSYGHALKSAGRQTEAVAAYRRALELAPQMGEAWFSLANLKTVRFVASDVTAMERALARPAISLEDRLHLHFALGKAREDEGEFATAFEHFEQGNTVRRSLIDYDARITTAHVKRSKAFFTPELFAELAGAGCPAPDPIFVVGLPRAGSTLLEQILASHPLVEGTQELPNVAHLARELGGKKSQAGSTNYPEVLEDLDAAALRALGERYLRETRIQRKTDRPFFVDKMPNNWAHVGLIHLILPNAKIIDARRHPLACCLSGYKQHFARGQHFTYSLEDIGRYYRDYVELMAHFDRVLPGRVHRAIYERTVDDFETEVRGLLAYCGLPFDERCLRFHENERAVRTASSEQVRQPLYREGKDHWRHYSEWLKPLERALGPVLSAYPATPHDDWSVRLRS